MHIHGVEEEDKLKAGGRAAGREGAHCCAHQQQWRVTSFLQHCLQVLSKALFLTPLPCAGGKARRQTAAGICF